MAALFSGHTASLSMVAPRPPGQASESFNKSTQRHGRAGPEALRASAAVKVTAAAAARGRMRSPRVPSEFGERRSASRIFIRN